MSASPTGQKPTSFDRVVATVAAAGIFGLVGYLLIRNEPINDPALMYALRLVLSFSAAALGATIPGFLNIRWTGNGFAIRAGGALALFLLTYIYTPDFKGGTNVRIEQNSGSGSVNSVGNSGQIQVNGPK